MIETRIEQCRDTAAENIVEIGRLLIRAKDEEIVPHGEWTDWVRVHAGMNERTAQRAMQIARELPEGSPLARLGVAKLSALLKLEAGEREAAAQQMDAEHLTSREVEERVKALRQERDEALRVVGEQKKRIQQIQEGRKAAIDNAVETERRAASVRERQTVEAAVRKATAEKQTELETIRSSLLRSESERAALSEKLQQAQSGAGTKEEIHELERRVEELTQARGQCEREIDRLSEQLDEANTALMRGGMASGGERPSACTRILSAIGALMAEAGNAPGELARTAGMDQETQQLLIGQAQLLGQWAMQIIAACGGDANA